VAAGGFWLASRAARLFARGITETLKARAEVEDSVMCGHDCVPGSLAYIQCVLSATGASWTEVRPHSG
jgi:hypothetical protein